MTPCLLSIFFSSLSLLQEAAPEKQGEKSRECRLEGTDGLYERKGAEKLENEGTSSSAQGQGGIPDLVYNVLPHSEHIPTLYFSHESWLSLSRSDRYSVPYE